MRPPRIYGFDYRGSYPYSLTFCTFRRRRYFEDASVVSIVLREIVRTAIESASNVLAYCFMPDHLHLLVQSHSPDADLLAFVKRCRQRTTVAVNRPDGALLWQRGYHERTLRSEERVETVAKYIVGPYCSAIPKTGAADRRDAVRPGDGDGGAAGRPSPRLTQSLTARAGARQSSDRGGGRDRAAA
jgi:putative transposase